MVSERKLKLLDYMKQFIGKEYIVEDNTVNAITFYTKPDVMYRVVFKRVGKDKVKITHVEEQTVLKFESL